MSNRKDLSLADFLAQDELREMTNEERRKSMKRKKEEQALRLMRMKDLVEDLESINQQIGYQESALQRMKIKVIVVLSRLNQLVKEQSPAPQRRRNVKKKRVNKIEKMRRSLKKYKRKKT